MLLSSNPTKRTVLPRLSTHRMNLFHSAPKRLTGFIGNDPSRMQIISKGKTNNWIFYIVEPQMRLRLTPLRSSAEDQWWILVGRFWSKQWLQLQWTGSASSGSSQSECPYAPVQLWLEGMFVDYKFKTNKEKICNITFSIFFDCVQKTIHSHLYSAQPQPLLYFRTHAGSAWWWDQRVWSHPGRRGHGAQTLRPRTVCRHTTSCLNEPRLWCYFGQSMQSTPLVRGKDNLEKPARSTVIYQHYITVVLIRLIRTQRWIVQCLALQ